VQVGEIYEFSGGRIRVANKRYQRCDCEFSITFGFNCMIKKLVEDNKIGQDSLKPTPIAEIDNIEIQS